MVLPKHDLDLQKSLHHIHFLEEEFLLVYFRFPTVNVITQFSRPPESPLIICLFPEVFVISLHVVWRYVSLPFFLLSKQSISAGTSCVGTSLHPFVKDALL